MKTLTPKQAAKAMKQANKAHIHWRKFTNWLGNTYGKDLLQCSELKIGNKVKKFKDINHLELSKRLVGYEVQERITKYVQRYVPAIKVLRCDDAVYASSIILLIPHPMHGITVIYIPQCTTIQNQFFLYQNHCGELIKTLIGMSKVYRMK